MWLVDYETDSIIIIIVSSQVLDEKNRTLNKGVGSHGVASEVIKVIPRALGNSKTNRLETDTVFETSDREK